MKNLDSWMVRMVNAVVTCPMCLAKVPSISMRFFDVKSGRRGCTACFQREMESKESLNLKARKETRQ